jgi:hypothetical protein
LLREIDRAFDGFDRSAVRYGWFAEPASDNVAVCQNGSNIDLADFVAGAIAIETGRQPTRHGALHLPPDWMDGLDGLPGFDRAHRVLRFIRDPALFRDSKERSLAFLGWAHPVVRRACASVQRGHMAGINHRVSVARAADGTPAVLLTYAAELRSKKRCEFRRVLAVLLPASGPAREIGEADEWLRWPELPGDESWHDIFVPWVSERLPEAEVAATAAMHREAERLSAASQRIYQREAEQLQAWLRCRADELCGAFVPRPADLFGDPQSESERRRQAEPFDRLAALATDADRPASLRREAGSVAALYQRRSDELAVRRNLLLSVLIPLGMLMLVP